MVCISLTWRKKRAHVNKRNLGRQFSAKCVLDVMKLPSFSRSFHRQQVLRNLLRSEGDDHAKCDARSYPPIRHLDHRMSSTLINEVHTDIVSFTCS